MLSRNQNTEQDFKEKEKDNLRKAYAKHNERNEENM
jgi:hypothetical protein